MTVASPDLAMLQQQAKALQAQIMEIGGPKLKRAQAKVDACVETLDTLTKALSSAEVGETSSRKQAAKAAAARAKSESELEKVSAVL
jgi:hypothetical protein